MQNHKKHEEIPRPALGHFARNEWAILGTGCGAIRKLVHQLTEHLAPRWKTTYVDADHKVADADSDEMLAKGAFSVACDKINFHRFDRTRPFSSFEYRVLFNEADIVFINGNHFTAQKQIVVVDPKKEESLQRKINRLTDVRLLLLSEGVTAPFDFLKEHLGSKFSEIPVFSFSDFPNILGFFETNLRTCVPPLNGLVLAGGKSRRMGRDKRYFEYHGIPQQDHALQLLRPVCEKVFLSCRPEQAGELAFDYDILPDTFTALGPLGAILSAFRQYPDSAWIVLACDLPLFDAAARDFLVHHRNPSALATAFRSPVTGFPEPLIAIWEPKSYPILLQFLAQGYSCPRKALINNAIELIEAPNPEVLTNVNTPEEAEQIFLRLKRINL